MDRLVKILGYGGELTDRSVSYALSQSLKKQHAVVRNNKQSPQVIRIEDVKPSDVSEEDLEAYKFKLYSRPWYKSPRQIEEETKQRIHVQSAPRQNNPTSPRRTPPHDPAGSKAPARETAFDRAKRDRNK